jgi:peptidoglycan hydrolase-like protein with peptidoglycan-binding domain
MAKPPAAPDLPPTATLKVAPAKVQLLRLGMRGADVALWRRFLRGHGAALPEQPEDLFDEACVAATRGFQIAQGIEVDGKVGEETWRTARRLDAALKPPKPVADPDLPVQPDPPRAPRLTEKRRVQLYTAPADWEVIAGARDPDAVRFTDGWEEANIVRVPVPELAGIPGARNDGVVRFHRMAAARLQTLFAAWKAAGLMDRVLTFDGGFNARMIRGEPKKDRPGFDPRHPKALSNHSFGLAFDINAAMNPLNQPPARRGERGCVYDLLPLAWDHGFFWGGNFGSPLDGMHFEVGDVPPDVIVVT